MLSSIISESFYVIDVAANQFRYISPDDPFLCDYSAEDAIKSGFDFYQKIIHPKDLSLWTNMYKAVLRHLEDPEKKQDAEYYFSCTFRLQRKYSFSIRPLLQMVFHRMKPVWENGKLHYLICSLGSSTAKEPGNLRMYNKSGLTYKEYNFRTRSWKWKTIEPLTERERVILMLAQQGKNSGEIANNMHKGCNTIRNQIKVLFSKLNVHTMQEAIEFTSRHHLINPKPGLQQQPIEVHHKRTRVLFTDDMKMHIQQYLDDGKSIRQAAKKGSISESAIRYWIKQGKLKKTDK
jgi:DNA-binding NarL/FixJ family response regulator